jgi:hypothetical protein
MPEQSSKRESLGSRILFLSAGIAVGVLLEILNIGGIWAVPVGILALILFGETYLFLTGNWSSGQ